MRNITFISTIHRESGKCNTDELYKIIEKIAPEVIFLEALDKTYSEYESYLFSTFGVFHNKLEISAIQKYSRNATFEYVSVCETGLTDAFHRKFEVVCQNREIQKLIDNFNFLTDTYGFEFLNSLECMNLQQELRVLESLILNNSDLDQVVKKDIDAYENSMVRNIYAYCNDNHFSSAIFMCGAAHRKAIIEKIEKYNAEEQVNVTWTFFENGHTG